MLDSLCGGGSIGVECVLWRAGCLALNGDMHALAVSRAAENFALHSQACRRAYGIVRWDTCQLPLRDGIVDAVACDLVGSATRGGG